MALRFGVQRSGLCVQMPPPSCLSASALPLCLCLCPASASASAFDCGLRPPALLLPPSANVPLCALECVRTQACERRPRPRRLFSFCGSPLGVIVVAFESKSFQRPQYSAQPPPTAFTVPPLPRCCVVAVALLLLRCCCGGVLFDSQSLVASQPLHFTYRAVGIHPKPKTSTVTTDIFDTQLYSACFLMHAEGV